MYSSLPLPADSPAPGGGGLVRALPALLCSLWAVATVGCGMRVHGGGAVSTSHEALEPVGMFAAHQTFGFFGASERVFMGPDIAMAALGAELSLMPGMVYTDPVRGGFFGSDAPGGSGYGGGYPGWKQSHRKKRNRRGRHRYSLSPSASLGVHALQLDWTDVGTTVGAGSPYADLGGHVCKWDRGAVNCLGLSLEAAHHVRFGQDAQTWIGASLVWSMSAVEGF